MHTRIAKDELPLFLVDIATTGPNYNMLVAIYSHHHDNCMHKHMQ